MAKFYRIKLMNNKKFGYTVVELLVVTVILAGLMVMSIMALNPRLLVDKGSDSKRKSDLNKIRTAFEEYFNDKGSYPDVKTWNVKSNCGKEVEEMAPYLKEWPCDPTGELYTILVDKNWFKVVTNLGNKKDKDIPSGWYSENSNYTTAFDKDEVNYGVSSLNVLWYEGHTPSADCETICLKQNVSGIGCDDAVGVGCSFPDICYLGDCGLDICKVSSCD